MSSQSSLKQLAGGSLGAEWQVVLSNGGGRPRLLHQWVQERRGREHPRLVRLCGGWARWGGHVRWEGTSGGGSHRGEETGQRARSGAGGVSGVRRQVRLDQEVAQGSLTPTYRCPPTSRGGREVLRAVKPPLGVVPGTRWSSVSGFSLLLGPALPDKPGRQNM